MSFAAASNVMPFLLDLFFGCCCVILDIAVTNWLLLFLFRCERSMRHALRRRHPMVCLTKTARRCASGQSTLVNPSQSTINMCLKSANRSQP